MDDVTSRRPLALITNDDGIDSAGLHALAAMAQDAGFDVVLAAPHVDASGTGTSMKAVRGPDGVALRRQEIPALPGVTAYAVEAHPAFIVHAAARGWLEPLPDLVLSGINYGANTGGLIQHSGTVGAVLAGALHGWSGLAVSLDSGPVRPEHPHWDAVAQVFPEAVELLRAAEPGTVLSLNVPDVPAAELGELREARLAKLGMSAINVHQPDEAGEAVLRATAKDEDEPPAPDSDVALLRAGHPTLTRLTPVGDRPGVLPESRLVDV